MTAPPKKLSPTMLAVRTVIRESGKRGMTDSEITAALLRSGYPEAPDSTYRKRRTDLMHLGFVEWSGARRRNMRGAMEKVWVIKTP